MRAAASRVHLTRLKPSTTRYHATPTHTLFAFASCFSHSQAAARAMRSAPMRSAAYCRSS